MKNLNLSKIFFLLSIFLAILTIVSLVVTSNNSTQVKNRYYDLQIEASTKTQQCFDAIKQYKIDHGIAFGEEDSFDSGMIGPEYTSIYTTMGDLRSKKTCLNPNFSALYIKFFQEASVKENDEIAIIMSGSFPTLNIAVMVASEVFNVKTCLMASIGSSSYGATDEELTFFDMVEYLNDCGLLNTRLDYVSFGGDYDTGSEFDPTVKEAITSRINNSTTTLISEENYVDNINLRTKLILDKCPNCKLLISNGGSLVAMGKGMDATTNIHGLVKPNYLTTFSLNKKTENIGLIDTFLKMDIVCCQMLNISSVCQSYDMPFNPDTIPPIGNGGAYYETKVNLVLPIVSVTLTISLLVLYFILERKKRGASL